MAPNASSWPCSWTTATFTVSLAIARRTRGSVHFQLKPCSMLSLESCAMLVASRGTASRTSGTAIIDRSGSRDVVCAWPLTRRVEESSDRRIGGELVVERNRGARLFHVHRNAALVQ